jgi:hypothetical protein
VPNVNVNGYLFTEISAPAVFFGAKCLAPDCRGEQSGNLSESFVSKVPNIATEETVTFVCYLAFLMF